MCTSQNMWGAKITHLGSVEAGWLLKGATAKFGVSASISLYMKPIHYLKISTSRFWF